MSHDTSANDGATNDDGVTAALRLYERGFHVFPVDHPNHPACIGAHKASPCDGTRGKHPTLAWGVWAVTNTVPMIEHEWSKPRYKGYANVGIACGPSNIVLLDEDKHGEIARLCADHGLVLPDTYAVSTGRGQHVYLHWDHSARRIPNNGVLKSMGYAIDVRGDGGMTVAEGSRHRSGAVYTGNDLPVADLPDALAHMLFKDKASDISREPIPLEVDRGRIAFHERHDALVAYAGRLRRSGLDYGEALPVFRERWLQCEQPTGEIPEARYHSDDCKYPVTWGEAQAKLADVFRRYAQGNGCGTEAPDATGRVLSLEPLSTVRKRKATWVWDYAGTGRIQHGVLTLFAGRPAAGKSTAARWFAAQLTQGALDGCWKGKPVNVAVLMTEEQKDVIVVPGLDAAGADLDRVFRPKVSVGTAEIGLAITDLAALTQELRDNNVRGLVVDPIMSLFDREMNVNATNEVRSYLEPFSQLAADIDGIVIGVTHLNKSQLRDILANINGSSAFGEVPRCVFGFAAIEGGDHIMQQAKNSAGRNDMALSYRLPLTDVVTDDGPAQLTRFEITGISELSITDLADNDHGEDATTLGAAKDWLKFYLLENQPAPSNQVKADAKAAGVSESTLHRARKRLSVRIEARSFPDKPRTTAWSLPASVFGGNDEV